MRDEEVPNNALKGFAMRRDVCGIHRGNNDARGGFFRRVTAIATDDADHRCADLFGELNRVDEIRTDIFFQIAAPNRKNQQAVFCSETTALEPFGENRRPAFVIGARGEFGNIVGRRVRFKAADLAKIIHGMTGVAGTAADTEDEKTAATIANGGEFVRTFFNGSFVELRRDLLDLGEKLFRETHSLFA